MSQEHVATIRRATDAFNRGGVEAALEFFDPEIEWTTTGIFLEPGTYRGHEGVRRYMGEFIDAGEQVVVPFRLSARGKQSGAPVEFSGALVYSFRGGKIFRIRNYTEKAEAFEAAGLRE